MKKLLAIGAISVFALTACFDSGDIAAVKDGVMDFDKSLKVGDALDNWNECTEKHWSAFKTSNGRRMVQFECKSTRVRDFMQYAKSHFSDQISPQIGSNSIDVAETAITFQWTINTDNSFELAAATQYLKWSDGAVYDAKAPAEVLLKIAYGNKVNFDVATLQTPEGSTNATAIAVNVAMIRRYGTQISAPNVPSPAPAIAAAPVAQAAPPAGTPPVEKKATAEAEDYAATWTSIQRDPNVYLASCASERKGDLLKAGALSDRDAQAQAVKDCGAEIRDIEKCMGKPNAKADICIDTARNTGG